MGYALRASAGNVPWQRVVGLRKKGCAHVTLKDPVGAAMQRRLLEREGVRFTRDGVIDLERYGVTA